MKKLSFTAIFILCCLFQFQTFAQIYHEDDKEGLRQFLRQPSDVSGKLNLEVLGLTIGDTLTWNYSDRWLDLMPFLELVWNGSTPKRITSFTLSNINENSLEKVSGELDCSKFTELVVLSAVEQKISSLNLLKNTHLRELYCSSNLLTLLDVSQCPNLEKIICSSNFIDDLRFNSRAKLNRIEVTNNYLTLSTLPNYPSFQSKWLYRYAPQKDFNGKNYPFDEIDLSKEYEFYGTVTNYSWYDNQNRSISIIDKGKGVFEVDKKYIGDTLVCHLRNGAYDQLKLIYKVKITKAIPTVFLQNHLMVRTNETNMYSAGTNENFKVFANISDQANASIGLFDQGGRFIEDVVVSKKNNTYTCKISDAVLPGNYMIQPYQSEEGARQVIERPANSYFIDKLPISITADDIWGRSARAGYVASDVNLQKHMQLKTSKNYYYQVSPEERFKVYANYLPTDSEIKIGLFNLYGAFVEDITISKKASTYTCQVSENVPSGDYVIMPYEMANNIAKIVERADGTPIMDRLPLTVEEDIWSFGVRSLSVKSDAKNKPSNVKLYPNPVSDILYLQADMMPETVEVYDLSGRLVKNVTGQEATDGVALQDLSSGTYIVKIGDTSYKIQKN